MSTISFSEFAKEVRSLFPRETQGKYVKTLLGEITDFGAEDENSPLHRPDDTYSRYFSGKPFRAIAKKLVPHLDINKFADYVSEVPYDVSDKVRESLAPFLSQTQNRGFPRACAELFAEIIRAEADGHSYSFDQNAYNQPSLELTVLPENDVDYLTAESDNRCLLCGTRLKERTKIEIVPSASGFEQRAEINAKLKEKGVEKLPDLNGDYDTHSISNLAVVHPDCAAGYISKYDPNHIADLYIKKQAANERLMLQDTLDILEIDDALGGLLKSINDLIDPEAIEELRYKPKKLSNKILPENTDLLFDVKDKVLCYFNFIKKALSELPYSNGFTFPDLARSMKRCFLMLDELGMDQIEIYSEMTNWVSERTGCKDLVACQILIAFFIQDCEVFHEIAE